MPTRHKNIAKSAQIGEKTTIGKNTIVAENVIIGKNCKIGNNVVIHARSNLGDNIRIDDNTIVGKLPMFSPRSIFKKEKKFQPTEIDDDCLIGANVVIYCQCKIGKKNLIADLATVRENVDIGDYNIIGRNVTIENYIKIGERNKFETNSYITAYSEIADYCFIAPNATTSNDNYMGRDKERYKHFQGIIMKKGSRLGVSCTILPGITINEDGVAAAGSLVTKDIPAQEIWAGTPAKYFKKVPKTQLLKNNLDK